MSIDGKPQQIMVSNYLTMSVLFPAGTHEVKFMYRNPAIVTAGIISYGSFFIVLAILSINWIRRRNYLAPLLIWCVPAGALLYYFL